MAADSLSSTPARASSSAFSRRSVVSRLRSKALGVGGHGGVAGVLALVERQEARGDRDGEERDSPAEEGPQAAVCPAAAVGLALADETTLLQERALEPVELTPVLRRPVERGRQPSAAVELPPT